MMLSRAFSNFFPVAERGESKNFIPSLLEVNKKWDPAKIFIPPVFRSESNQTREVLEINKLLALFLGPYCIGAYVATSRSFFLFAELWFVRRLLPLFLCYM